MTGRLQRNPSQLCSSCARPGTRQIGYDRYCDPCGEAVLAPIRERVITETPDPFGGHGRQDGPLRADYGPGWADLRCDRCGATWVGKIDDPCTWCARQYEILIETQREVLLNPDLPEPDDARRKQAEVAWAERLGRAVKAGIIDEKLARRTLEREVAKSS